MTTYAKIRPMTTKLLEMAESGDVSWESLARDALSWMGEQDVREFADCNYCLDEDEG